MILFANDYRNVTPDTIGLKVVWYKVGLDELEDNGWYT
jgi:hypothetical protein